MSAKTPAKGHTSKHAHKTSKHHKAKGKHHPGRQPPSPVLSGGLTPVHTVARVPHHAKPRGFAVGDVLPVCSFEAVAQSLRLAGQRVSDDEVAALWELCGSREASIAEALEAAARFRLGAYQPRWAPVLDPLGARGLVVADAEFGGLAADEARHALILGVNVPGPHAVLATADGWWSWGALYDPWTDEIDEAWAVSWS